MRDIDLTLPLYDFMPVGAVWVWNGTSHAQTAPTGL